MTDMRDDLDELGRRLWPTTDALRPAEGIPARSRQRPGRRFWRFEPLVTLAAAVLLVGVIGGAVVLGRSLSSPTPVPAGPSGSSPVSPTSPTATASSSPSPTAAPVPHVIVWAVGGASDTVIRVGTASGGFRTVATFPQGVDATILGAGGHHVLFWEGANGHLYDIDINTGAIADHGGAAGDTFHGAAFSPDGTQVEYLQQTDPNTGQIRLLDFSTGVITGLLTFPSGPFDVPRVWSAAGIAANLQPAGNGGPPGAGFAILDPSTGAPVATTNSRVGSWAIASDGTHAAESLGTPATNDIAPVPLSTVVIGSPPQAVLSENANHFLAVVGLTPDGATVLYSDEPTMGGYAGITLSPDYGLFTLSAGHRTQVAHYSGTNDSYAAAAYLNDSDFVIAANSVGPSGPTSALLQHSSAGGPLTPLDTAAGAASFVSVVTG